MLCEISRVEYRKKLFSLRIVRIIQMKVKVASDKKLLDDDAIQQETFR